MESKSALALVKFWLDTASFKTSVEHTQLETRSLESHDETDRCIPIEIDDQPLTDDEKMNNKNRLTMTKHDIQCDINHDETVVDPIESSIDKHDELNNSQIAIATDALHLFQKYFINGSTYFIDFPAEISNNISLALDSINDTTSECIQRVALSSDLFGEAQNFVHNRLDTEYVTQFHQSTYHCKYCIDILTSGNIQLNDILYSEVALFYFMEFLEQEGQRHLLDFWVSAINFKKFNSKENEFDKNEAQNDAVIIYDKYFSLQANAPLSMSDAVRFKVEEKICSENERILEAFDYPIIIIEEFLKYKYLESFLKSSLFDKYLSEILTRTEERKTVLRRHSSLPTKNSRCQSLADIENNSDVSSISSKNTLLAMQSSAVPKHTMKTSATSSDLQIDFQQIYNPDLLWKRRSDSLSFGRVDALGRYEREFDLDVIEEKRKLFTPKGNKLKNAVKMLVKFPNENRKQEEIAWQVAEMIIKDVTNITLNKTEDS